MTRIRPVTIDDAPYVAELLNELGYEVSLVLAESKLAKLSNSPSDLVLAAEFEGRIVGLISLHTLELFHVEGRLGRITALVISSAHRGKGIGKQLVQAADRYFAASGCIRAEVTSGDHRPEAHAFYRAQGFLADERRFIKRYSPVLLTD